MFSYCILSLKTSTLIRTRFLSASPHPSPQKSTLRKGGSRPPSLPPRSYKPPFSPDLDKLQEVLHIEQKPITPGYFLELLAWCLGEWSLYIKVFVLFVKFGTGKWYAFVELAFISFLHVHLKLTINEFLHIYYCMFPIFKHEQKSVFLKDTSNH